jgi:hypothetical protein
MAGTQPVTPKSGWTGAYWEFGQTPEPYCADVLHEVTVGCSDQDESMLGQLSPKFDNGDKSDAGEYAAIPLSTSDRSFASWYGEGGE